MLNVFDNAELVMPNSIVGENNLIGTIRTTEWNTQIEFMRKNNPALLDKIFATGNILRKRITATSVENSFEFYYQRRAR